MTQESTRIDFLDHLRALAAWLVVWDHLACMAPTQLQQPLGVAQWVSAHVNQPLGLIQDFGWFGVCLFFLISGFVITHVSLRESARAFAIKRLFRIVPMLAVAVLLALLLSPDLRRLATPLALLTNVTLLNYWIAPQVVLVGVGWTLAIEVAFYALMLASFPLARWPGLRSAALLAVVALTTWQARAFGDSFFLFAASMAYVPYLIAGQVLYLAFHQRSIGGGMAALLALGVYATLWQGLHGIHVDFVRADNSYLASFGWALVVFLLAWLAGARLRSGPIVRSLSATSYTLYLVHGMVGLAVIPLLAPHVGMGMAVLSSIVAVGVVVMVLHLLVERPALELGRRLADRYRSAQPSPAERAERLAPVFQDSL
jgi:peptidoglycan/LPS O-acetylase OafA/YrhL